MGLPLCLFRLKVINYLEHKLIKQNKSVGIRCVKFKISHYLLTVKFLKKFFLIRKTKNHDKAFNSHFIEKLLSIQYITHAIKETLKNTVKK